MISTSKNSPSEPIRIAYVIDQMGIGGTERQVAALINRLDRKRFKPYMVTIHKYEKCFDLDCEWHFFPMTRLCSPNALTRLLQIALMFRREQIQIAHTFFADATYVGILAAWIARVPVIVSSRRDMGFWHTPARLMVVRILNRLTDRILANSESVRQATSQKEKVSLDRIDVIYNGLEPELFYANRTPSEAKKALRLEPTDPVIGIVSNLNRQVKRLDVFIDAIPLVIKRVRPVKFVIVGKGHMREEFENKCRLMGIAEDVVFTGGVQDIRSVLPAFDIGVNSSDSEGFSNAVMEYMAAGIPAVVSDVGGNHELIEDGPEGYLFPPGDPAALAEKLIRLLQNPHLAKEMGARGRKKALRDFSLDSMVHNHMEYYEALLVGPASERAKAWTEAKPGEEISR